MRVYVAQINPIIGDIEGNCAKISEAIQDAKTKAAEIVLFSELAVTGYPPDDLLLLPKFIFAVEDALKELSQNIYDITAIIGTPRQNRSSIGKTLYNSAAVISDGRIIGYQDKILLPTYDVFDERRYFEPGGKISLWEIAGKQVAITICEDIWEHSEQIFFDHYERDPVLELKQTSLRPDILLNLSASPYSVLKAPLRAYALENAAKALRCPAILCNQVGGNDSLIFDGRSLVVDRKGALVQRAAGFKEDGFVVDTQNFPSKISALEGDILEELYSALVLGVRDYFGKQGFKTACLGLSGGIDSALVACIAVDALGKENVLALAMPSRYSSPGSITDAEVLAKNLGIRLVIVPIEEAFSEFLTLLKPEFQDRPYDVTEENLQSRIRGIILMSFSNKFGCVVLNTGNKSELAMGYSTLYGDMCGGLGVISDLSKRRVYALAEWINRNGEIIPHNTIIKPPSAELRENQKDSDSLPDYEYIDIVLEQYLEKHRSPEAIILEYRIAPEIVNDIVQRIHRSEYKRRQSAPGLRVTERAFSIGRKFPIVQRWVK